MAGPRSGAKAVACPGAEVPAEPNSPHGFCPQCPAASARTAGKAAATGSIKLKCFLFQTIKRHHDTRGTKRLEETLCSLLPTPLPTSAAWRDRVGHQADPHARGRTGLPQAPCFRVPLSPAQGRPQCRASAGAALPAANQGRYSQGASMAAAGDGQDTCPQMRLQVGTRRRVGTHWQSHHQQAGLAPAEQRGAGRVGQTGERTAAPHCHSITLTAQALASPAQSFRPRYSNSEHSAN